MAPPNQRIIGNPNIPGPRVALLIEGASSWGRDLLRGISDYLNNKAVSPWFCYWLPWGKQERIMLPKHLKLDGVIARVTHEELARDIVESGIPGVNVSWYRFPGYKVPRCTCDEWAGGKLMADYLVSLRYPHFAYCPAGERGNQSERLGDAFINALRQRGHSCQIYETSSSELDELTSWQEVSRLGAWIDTLKKPVAILAFHDAQARLITLACQQYGFDVPRQVAVMGGEYDELSSLLSTPTLTCVDLSARRVGFEAAQLLESLMFGAAPPESPILVHPNRIIPGQSTDWLVVEDELVLRAIHLIEDRLSTGIRVSDLLEDLSVSRRTLEQRFKRSLGRSPAEEIRRAQVHKAAELLYETSLPITQIAIRCGFERLESFTRAFKREYMKSPSEFRKQSLKD